MESVGKECQEKELKAEGGKLGKERKKDSGRVACRGGRPPGGGGGGEGVKRRKGWALGLIGLGLICVVWIGGIVGFPRGLQKVRKEKVTVRVGSLDLVFGLEKGAWEVEELVIDNGDRKVNVDEGLVEDLWKGVEGRNMEKLVVSTGRRSGVPEKWMGTFQRSVMRKLVTSGLLPIFEIEVVAGGAKSMNVEGGEAVRNCQGDVAGGSETCRPGDREESEIVGLGRMEYYYDQDLEEVVDKFCRTHGVKGKQAKDVWNTVEREARRRGVIPEVEIALDLMDKEKQESHLKNEKWRIYQRRSILESLGGYQEENNKLQRAPRAIVARFVA